MRNIATFGLFFCLASIATSGIAAEPAAETAYQQGLALQKEHRSQEAIRAYHDALRRDPGHGRAHYELGWSYWTLRDWARAVAHWEKATNLGAATPELPRFLLEARNYLAGKGEPLIHAEIGTRSQPLIPHRPVELELVARFQHYNDKPGHPRDVYDPYVFSPKSVRVVPDGTRAYVNALEGYATIVFDPVKLRRIDTIVHRFRAEQRALFEGANGTTWLPWPAEGAPANPNQFNGKPVESALSADGRFLWVPYYRRDFDPYSTMPSAVAVIDSATNRIVRVMETGPIPKYVVGSPDGKWMAVVHWGDNTVGLIDTSPASPSDYRHGPLVVVGKRIDLGRVDTRDRDHDCGFCLRGAVFSPDSRYLLVARMGGGGIAVIDARRGKYLGTVHGMRPTPRHLELSSDGKRVYLSSSFAGYVSYYELADLIDAVEHKRAQLKPAMEGYAGPATRTIALSPDGKFVYAAVNKDSKIVVLDAESLQAVATVDADSYPVGLAVSPDGGQLWVTAQGRDGRGGNSVSVYAVTTRLASN
jgi:YVTN family beta-propeller protein